MSVIVDLLRARAVRSAPSSGPIVPFWQNCRNAEPGHVTGQRLSDQNGLNLPLPTTTSIGSPGGWLSPGRTGAAVTAQLPWTRVNRSVGIESALWFRRSPSRDLGSLSAVCHRAGRIRLAGTAQLVAERRFVEDRRTTPWTAPTAHEPNESTRTPRTGREALAPLDAAAIGNLSRVDAPAAFEHIIGGVLPDRRTLAARPVYRVPHGRIRRYSKARRRSGRRTTSALGAMPRACTYPRPASDRV